jgi:hypothetical protein
MATTLPEEKVYRERLKTYKNEFRTFLLTSRFSTATWNENQKYRRNNPKIGCIYCAPQQVTTSIPVEAVLFILEMNNDTNKIMGIGMVRNHPHLSRYNVYNNGNYNRYAYAGKNRIDRNEMTEKEEEIMKFFDIICFSGNKHMKRGQGLQSFPIDIIYRCKKEVDLVDFISTMFKSRLATKI